MPQKRMEPEVQAPFSSFRTICQERLLLHCFLAALCPPALHGFGDTLATLGAQLALPCALGGLCGDRLRCCLCSLDNSGLGSILAALGTATSRLFGEGGGYAGGNSSACT